MTAAAKLAEDFLKETNASNVPHHEVQIWFQKAIDVGRQEAADAQAASAARAWGGRA